MNPRILRSLLQIFQRFSQDGIQGLLQLFLGCFWVEMGFLGKGLLPFPRKTRMEPKARNWLREGGNVPGSGISMGWARIYGRRLRWHFLPFGMGFQAAPRAGRKEGREGEDPGGIRGHRERPRIRDGEVWKSWLRDICMGNFFPSLFPRFPWFYPWINNLSLVWWEGRSQGFAVPGILGLEVTPIPILFRDSVDPQGPQISPKKSSHGDKDVPASFSQGKQLDLADRGSFPS